VGRSASCLAALRFPPRGRRWPSDQRTIAGPSTCTARVDTSCSCAERSGPKHVASGGIHPALLAGVAAPPDAKCHTTTHSAKAMQPHARWGWAIAIGVNGSISVHHCGETAWHPRRMSGTELRERFCAVPRRIYLDTSTLQAIHDNGEVLFDSVTFIPRVRSQREPDYADQINALRMILLVNQRADFLFVITEASLHEVVARNSYSFFRWALDVQEAYYDRLVEPRPKSKQIADLDERRFGNISKKDKFLLRAALDSGCDAFLTMEKRLPRVGPFVHRTTGLRILRPTTYWQTLQPWASLLL
jgi:hypothetical protein